MCILLRGHSYTCASNLRAHSVKDGNSGHWPQFSLVDFTFRWALTSSSQQCGLIKMRAFANSKHCQARFIVPFHTSRRGKCSHSQRISRVTVLFPPEVIELKLLLNSNIHLTTANVTANVQNLKGRSEAAARVLLPFEGWCRGPRYCGNLCTLSPWSGSLCQCAMIIGVGQLFHLPVDLLQPLSQISVYPCVKEPALSRRDPHHQSWRIEDEKLTQVLVGPHGFQLIFLDFSLALLFPAQPCSQFPTLLKANSYLRGTVFIETL